MLVLIFWKDETRHDGERVLLLSLEHAASGTNLTAANHVFQLKLGPVANLVIPCAGISFVQF